MNLGRNTRRLLLLKYNYCIDATKFQSVWTNDKIVKSPYGDIEIPDCTIVEHIWKNVHKWAEKPAVVCGITNRTYSYNDLYRSSKSFAANLRKKLKIQDGDVVSIMMPNSPEYVIAALGVLQAGAELTTINPIYTSHEFQTQIELSKPKAIIGIPETIKVIKDGLASAKLPIPILSVVDENSELPIGTISFREFIDDNTVDMSILNKVKKGSNDIGLILYSSGTTGLPKGVELTNRNMVANFVQQDVECMKQYNDTTNSHQDTVLAVLPFYHCFGMSMIMMHKLSIGAKLITLPNFQPNIYISTIMKFKVNLLYLVPPIALYLAANDDIKINQLASIENIMSGASRVPDSDINKVLEKTKPGTSFLQMYGLTETGPLATTPRPGDKNYSTSGHPVSNTELKVINSNLKALGPNEVGEILIRGPQIMKGYRNNTEATKNSFFEDIWLKTGDLGMVDEYGAVTIVDRIKELIKVKGYQVPPAELEYILKDHPGVIDVAVIGTPDTRKGEVPRAFVVAKDNYKVTAEELIEFVKSKVAEYKQLKDVTFLKSLPKNPSGKLLKRVLRDKYC